MRTSERLLTLSALAGRTKTSIARMPATAERTTAFFAQGLARTATTSSASADPSTAGMAMNGR